MIRVHASSLPVVCLMSHSLPATSAARERSARTVRTDA